MHTQFSIRSTRTSLLAGAVLAAFAASDSLADYPSTVLSDSPLGYYRFNDDTSRVSVNKNSGSLGASGNATNDLPVVRPFPGAIAGNGNRSSFFDFASRTIIPWNAALNPANTQPFTVEAWLYPASDQINGGQCPINNRYAYSTSTPGRQGWVFFQRAPDLSYSGKPGYEGVGWNFRMYRGSGGSSGVDVTSQVPYQVGKWTHVVVVYDPAGLTNASAIMYIDGVAANTNTWTGGSSGTDPGYAANTNDHDPAEAVRGAAGLSFGQYNNTATPNSNPYFGAVDEFAFYAKKLTSAQILAHYQNGTNASRGTPYETLIQSDSPVEYLRLDEIAPGPDVAINMGDLRSAGNATHTAEVRHPAASALAGRTDDGAAAYHKRNGNSTTTMPWAAANNPNAGVPFTFEGWFRPMKDEQGGQCPVNNRWVGGTGRTGWVIFQRNPNLTYPASEGHGWNFRMYSGAGSGGQDILTATDYSIGQWQHLVFTWQPETDNGDPSGNGNNQWVGVLTAYVNGVAVATNIAARYAANVNPPEDGGAPADFAVGSYNAKSGLGNNPYEGDVDEVAIYTNYVLTAEQILAHYRAGANSRPATNNYETLVLTATSDGTGLQRQGPPTYLRFNDPALYTAANAGTLGSVADGNLVLATNGAAGPRPPALAGFESANTAVSLDSSKNWASLNNPSGLNVSGQITLEAWIKPGATQGDPARILSHGPPTLSNFLSSSPETNAAPTSAVEVSLRIDGGGTSYSIGSSDGTNSHGVSFAVPAGDLGGTNWIHLVGTYDGSNWRLYRNGAQVAAKADSVGALVVNNADWAIGSTGNGWEGSFAGAIDEVAIYNKALSASRVQAHYAAGQSGAGNPITIAIVRSGASNVTLRWTAGVLQESANVNGPFATVSGANSPYTIPASAATRFYRAQQ
ncbi:MAG: LamG domain-containing protein [Verrucomicrobia bacterium]|nr:LamG domain-containing protein [Verrucomicrobiota bacterium]